MDRFDRIYALHKLLKAHRYPVPLQKIMDELECSRATAKRVIRDMRLYLDAPIIYDRGLGGYRYAQTGNGRFELPGLWFSAGELHALLAAEQILEHLEPGLLASEIAPLARHIRQLVEHRPGGLQGLSGRVHFQPVGRRTPNPLSFRKVAEALATRHCLSFEYAGRARTERTMRRVSPLRLVYYRENWYLDGWCHLRRALRTFALERMAGVRIEEKRAREVSDERLNRYFDSTYGIFSGTPKHTAVLRFTPARARWVAEEQWHPDQQGAHLPDGGYELRVPYSDPRELIMDILKYGPDVEVVAPPSLRKEVAQRLSTALMLYRDRLTE